MVDKKTCWQITYLPKQTPCFQMAGNTPCDADDCLVENAAKKIPFVNQDLILRLCHSTCRLSCVSEDNQEFLIRMSNKGNNHLLSILE
jgi:hypothetical protein